MTHVNMLLLYNWQKRQQKEVYLSVLVKVKVEWYHHHEQSENIIRDTLKYNLEHSL